MIFRNHMKKWIKILKFVPEIPEISDFSSDSFDYYSNFPKVIFEERKKFQKYSYYKNFNTEL